MKLLNFLSQHAEIFSWRKDKERLSLGMQTVGHDNLISFVARNAVVDVHYHQCFQLVVSLKLPFNSIIGGKSYENLKGFLVNQTVPHSCKAQETEVMIYFIDAESYQGWQMKEMLQGDPYAPIDVLLTGQDLQEIVDEYRNAEGLEAVQRVADNLLEKVLPNRRERNAREADERILKAIDYIEENLDNPLALEDISKEVYLSAERLRHLFVQETGIPFSQYILWKRIKTVLTQVVKGRQTMATAAVQNGFTDQAHFTRLFKRTFGVSAGSMLKNSRFVQFLQPAL